MKIYRSFINQHTDNELKPLLSNEDEECVICLDELSLFDVKTLDCGHTFHQKCINSWTDIQVTCPICRSITATSFKGFVIPKIWCLFFKRKANISCTKDSIVLDINYFCSTKTTKIPYKKIHSISATANYLIIHMKTKNITVKLLNMDISCLYNLLYNTLHNSRNEDTPF